MSWIKDFFTNQRAWVLAATSIASVLAMCTLVGIFAETTPLGLVSHVAREYFEARPEIVLRVDEIAGWFQRQSGWVIVVAGLFFGALFGSQAAYNGFTGALPSGPAPAFVLLSWVVSIQAGAPSWIWIGSMIAALLVVGFLTSGFGAKSFKGFWERVALALVEDVLCIVYFPIFLIALLSAPFTARANR